MIDSGIILTYTLGWLPMVIIAITNGVLRELGYGRLMSELHSHQLSSILGVAAFMAYTFLLNEYFPIPSLENAVIVGAVWLILTVSFEFIFGHYVAGHSWQRLLSDYNILKGRVWSLVLISIFLAPAIIFFSTLLHN